MGQSPGNGTELSGSGVGLASSIKQSDILRLLGGLGSNSSSNNNSSSSMGTLVSSKSSNAASGGSSVSGDSEWGTCDGLCL